MSGIIRPTRRWFAVASGAAAASVAAPAVSIGAPCPQEREWYALRAACAPENLARSFSDWQALDDFERSVLLSPPGSIEELRLAVAIARRAIVVDDAKSYWSPRAVVNGAAQFFGLEAAEAPPEDRR